MNHQFPFKMAGDQPSKHLLEKLQKDQRLLESIQAHLPELESLLYVFQSDYEDRMYRLDYQSFKVLHAKYFLEMMVRYAKELDTAPSVLPTGWAAILCLYNQR